MFSHLPHIRTPTFPLTTARRVSRINPSRGISMDVRNQVIDRPGRNNAIFLTVTADWSAQSTRSKVRSVLGSVDKTTKQLSGGDAQSALQILVGLSSGAWDALTTAPRPKELRPFPYIKGAKYDAPSTPGDIFFHIRCNRYDLAYELEARLLGELGDSVKVVDETVGFRYLDDRDLLGFVEGTANPEGDDLTKCTIITEDIDPAGKGGSYVVTQKYQHDMKAWEKLPVKAQEAIVGRTKQGDVELDDQPEPDQKPHKQLATITDDQGNEFDIIRHNMPFGSPAKGDFGLFFIGYSARLWVVEKMLERMFVGAPKGKYDRILDASRASTGNTFFVPPVSFLNGLAEGDTGNSSG